jgi:hypothetical protein
MSHGDFHSWASWSMSVLYHPNVDFISFGQLMPSTR